MTAQENSANLLRSVGVALVKQTEVCFPTVTNINKNCKFSLTILHFPALNARIDSENVRAGICYIESISQWVMNCENMAAETFHNTAFRSCERNVMGEDDALAARERTQSIA